MKFIHLSYDNISQDNDYCVLRPNLFWWFHNQRKIIRVSIFRNVMYQVVSQHLHWFLTHSLYILDIFWFHCLFPIEGSCFWISWSAIFVYPTIFFWICFDIMARRKVGISYWLRVPFQETFNQFFGAKSKNSSNLSVVLNWSTLMYSYRIKWMRPKIIRKLWIF